MKKDSDNKEIEELVKEYYETGDESIKNIIIGRFEVIVRNCCSKLFLVYGDTDDLIQEGNIGLLKAIDSFEPEKSDKFIPFAIRCIKSSQINAVKKEIKDKIKNEKKEKDTDSYGDNEKKKDEYIPRVVSLDHEVEKGTNEMLLKANTLSPENIVIGNVRAADIFNTIEKNLSKKENEVLLYLVDGMNYKEIAEILGVSAKSIDNTIQRIRNKVSEIIKGEKNE